LQLCRNGNATMAETHCVFATMANPYLRCYNVVSAVSQWLLSVGFPILGNFALPFGKYHVSLHSGYGRLYRKANRKQEEK